jgi:hypothetical protein
MEVIGLPLRSSKKWSLRFFHFSILSLPSPPESKVSTGQVFEAISKLECIKPFTLVGGTALSLQIEKRQSEDLDFMKWLTRRNEKPDVNWSSILKEL